MIKKVLFFVLIFVNFIILTSYKNSESQKAGILKVLSVEYFSVNSCEANYPIYVRVKFQYSGGNLKNTKMVQKFAEGFTKTIDVENADKQGNAIYDFCTTRDKNFEFTTIFVSAGNNKSNEVIVKIDVKNAQIIASAAPQIFPVD
jgi:hypothetical protein